MALSIPITLAMTFGMMSVLGVDLQQVSVASLIIALGLLVDDPVVAGDAIKRALNEGKSPLVAAWLGPTKLATAILFATITNIVAYLPLLILEGENALTSPTDQGTTRSLRRPGPSAPDPVGWPSLRDTLSPDTRLCRGGWANQRVRARGPAAGGPPSSPHLWVKCVRSA